MDLFSDLLAPPSVEMIGQVPFRGINLASHSPPVDFRLPGPLGGSGIWMPKQAGLLLAPGHLLKIVGSQPALIQISCSLLVGS